MLNLIKESPINHRLPKNILHRMIDFGPIANFEWIWPANLSIFANGRVGQDKGWILVAQWTKLFAVELGCWVLQNCRLQRKKRDPCSKCNVCHSIWTQGGSGGKLWGVAGGAGGTGNRLFGGLGDQPASATQAVAAGQQPTRKLGDTALIQTKQDPTLFDGRYHQYDEVLVTYHFVWGDLAELGEHFLEFLVSKVLSKVLDVHVGELLAGWCCLSRA